MNGRCFRRLIAVVAILALPSNFAHSQQVGPLRVFPEQRAFNIRSPEQLPSAPIPATRVPFTVSTPEEQREERLISLDEAIQIAIANADVIRVLTGISASSSGRTIYDVAIANTGIDLQTSVFDPRLDVTSTYGKTDNPGATFDPLDPTNAIFVGSSTDSFNNTVSLTKQAYNGATTSLNATSIGSYFEPGVFPLDPEYRSFVELALRQPMMRGFGREANLAPVVIGRIDTERSYFQFKDTVQELVRGVIAAYWNVVSARIDVWAREQQVEQAEFAFQRSSARLKRGLATVADVAQTRSALANFKAGLITARSNLILTETALRNILKLGPSDEFVFVPSSEPILDRVDFDWDEIVMLAEQNRPDIIELKLILEADCQALLQADNLAKPQFDGIANYRWNGLSGEVPNGSFLSNDPGRFAGFNLGVNFSVPMGLRQDRASLRRQELILARDRINLEQGLHQMIHQLTINYRNLDQFFEQIVALQEAREAARLSFENQAAEVLAQRREFINVLQAITDWGNAVSAEASAITQYNIELANVERQTGTILETHGVRFVEERYGSLGPKLFGIRRSNECYPEKLRVEGAASRYPASEGRSDDSFNLERLKVPRESDRLRIIKPKEESLIPNDPAVPQPGFEQDPDPSGYFSPRIRR